MHVFMISFNSLFPEITRACKVVTVVKNKPANAGDIRDVGSIPGLGRSPRERNSNPFQYSCLENCMDIGAWWATSTGSQRIRHDWTCIHYLNVSNIWPAHFQLSFPYLWQKLQFKSYCLSLYSFCFWTQNTFQYILPGTIINQFTLVHETYLLPIISIV